MLILTTVFIAFALAFTGHPLLAIAFSQICLVLELGYRERVAGLKQKLLSQERLLLDHERKLLAHEKGLFDLGKNNNS